VPHFRTRVLQPCDITADRFACQVEAYLQTVAKKAVSRSGKSGRSKDTESSGEDPKLALSGRVACIMVQWLRASESYGRRPMQWRASLPCRITVASKTVVGGKLTFYERRKAATGSSRRPGEASMHLYGRRGKGEWVGRGLEG
jgi:hypothetical protein